MDNEILHLVLKHVWFEKIKSGQKTSEYRACSDYWNKKFEPIISGNKKIWKFVVFHDGYSDKVLRCELVSISKTNARNDLNLPRVWELKLGRIVN